MRADRIPLLPKIAVDAGICGNAELSVRPLRPAGAAR